MSESRAWGARDAAGCIAVPTAADDKYSRGVLGVVTGSDRYPGAAVLGVDAALHTGLGMVRYLGPERAAALVLQRRPEAVTAPGRVQAWLLGSGVEATGFEGTAERAAGQALAAGLPLVLDAGAIGRVGEAGGAPVILTPHHGELARLLGVDRASVAADPALWARRASDRTGATVLLKGAVTRLAGPGIDLAVEGAPAWLATAGTGDALAGILGALLASNAGRVRDRPEALAELGATAALVHGRGRGRGGGPVNRTP
ncbi:MAG: NAD(P)H-hydrate dehydratase, partial [Microbacteriaceae bacterium]